MANWGRHFNIFYPRQYSLQPQARVFNIHLNVIITSATRSATWYRPSCHHRSSRNNFLSKSTLSTNSSATSFMLALTFLRLLLQVPNVLRLKFYVLLIFPWCNISLRLLLSLDLHEVTWWTINSSSVNILKPLCRERPSSFLG